MASRSVFKLTTPADLDFVVFIITHGRPNRVITYETLRRSGYTGPIRLLVDNLDDTVEQYRAKYGDEVIVFDKRAVAKTTDNGDNFNNLRTTTHARNASFEIAKKLGYKYFIQLDDDYTWFRYRFDDKFGYGPKTIRRLDRVFAALLKFYASSSLTTLAISQGGDFIGGPNGSNPYCKYVQVLRKAMNLFVCSTDRPFKFVSRLNEDVNTYASLGARGQLFFTLNQICLEQVQTQASAGGMTEAYLAHGTYVKSFYSVMYQPSSVKVGVLYGRGEASRIHHKIAWRNTIPMIVREEVRKNG